MSFSPVSTFSFFSFTPLRQAVCLLLMVHGSLLPGSEPAIFTPPQAYPASRYEAGWSKKPFNLKTIAPIAAQNSFARDLAIGAHYGAADNPTVVIVNTKTRERILLRRDQPAPGGMRLKSVRLSSTRGECQAEVVFGAEAALLTYDSQYLGQLAASETSRRAAAKPAAAPPGHPPILPRIPLPAAAPSSAFLASRRFSPPQPPASTPARARITPSAAP